MDKERLSGGAVIAGLSLAVIQMALWYEFQSAFALGSRGPVFSFFVLEGAYLAIVAGGLLLFLRFLALDSRGQDYTSLRRVLADSFESKKDRRNGLAAGLVYFFFYMFISSTVVFQPQVDFATYGFSTPGWVASACCGDFGAVPSIDFFVSPQLHLAVRLAPMNLLLAAVVPILVGLNVSVLSFSYRNRPNVSRTGWAGALGALAALFTSCPACAGYFLASSLGGLGAASVAVGLAPYQYAFVAFSVPLLVASPVLMAASLRRAYLSGCKIEGRAFSPLSEKQAA